MTALAFLHAPETGQTNRLLADLAARLAAQGLRVCGCVQIDSPRDGQARCDMDLRLLPDGAMLRISENRGPGAGGCQLDAAALETAVAEISLRLAQGADLLILNKFGKQEAAGHGFRALIAEAVAAGLPVLVGLNRSGQAGFDAFAAGMAQPLPPDAQALEDWANAALNIRDPAA
ncbi:DUF2478 domain-containing protein [Szabonella alba]|uniref:DUF2478 domain-containing protein n=1 Tax=Szabonella alba TaxID=2804194 RepID=A0A8K0V8P4_9RHOB|nr:DUF2478 domain-containing protein [Szabonella alba]MBL4915733.1 DUF2478 domain-containing protein [Szabonella alba]